MSIEAMKFALDALSPRFGMPVPEYKFFVSCAIDELRTAIEQAEKQEPVAWTVPFLITDFSRDFSAYKTKTYTQPLYTAPPQREWVKLTDKERMQLAVDAGAMSADWLVFMEAVEAKLKEKNGC